MEQVRVRPRIELGAFRWDGTPVVGFSTLWLSRDGIEPLLPTLKVKGPTVAVTYARPGDWIICGPAGPFVVSDAKFLEDYEVVG